MPTLLRWAQGFFFEIEETVVATQMARRICGHNDRKLNFEL
jgi:hypothetical protein